MLDATPYVTYAVRRPHTARKLTMQYKNTDTFERVSDVLLGRLLWIFTAVIHLFAPVSQPKTRPRLVIGIIAGLAVPICVTTFVIVSWQLSISLICLISFATYMLTGLIVHSDFKRRFGYSFLP